MPEDFRHHLPELRTFTVRFLGLKGLKNGRLLERLNRDGYDALVTIDTGIPHQQNLGALPVTVVLIDIGSDILGDLVPFAEEVSKKIRSAPRGSFIRITRNEK